MKATLALNGLSYTLWKIEDIQIKYIHFQHLHINIKVSTLMLNLSRLLHAQKIFIRHVKFSALTH